MSSPRGSVSAKKSTIAKALGPRYLDDEQRGEAEKETKRNTKIVLIKYIFVCLCVLLLF